MSNDAADPATNEPKNYKVICVSIYVKDLEYLDQKVEELKRRGWFRSNRSRLIREAVARLNIDHIKLDDPTLAEPAPDNLDDPAHPVMTLTTRERQVMSELVMGKKNNEIAEQLGVSVKTIDTHRGHILKRLGLRNNADLTRFAFRHGLVALEDE